MNAHRLVNALRRCRRAAMLLSLAVVFLQSSPANALTIYGVKDPEYGPALASQSCLTNRGDNPASFTPGPLTKQMGIGSELDEASAFVVRGTLFLFIAGNLLSYQGEPLTVPDQLEVFVDCAPGGQNVLSSSNPAAGGYLKLNMLAGLTFDADFAADYWFDAAVSGSGPTNAFEAFMAALPADASGNALALGRGAAGAGTLSGGTNPYGIQATIDQSNRGGVTAGCGTGSGAGVTTGVEWAIPLAAIGNPTGPIKICALVARETGPGTPAMVSNQVLGPLPSATCDLGSAPTVNFGAIPGEQFFLLDAPTPSRAASWGRLKFIYR